MLHPVARLLGFQGAAAAEELGTELERSSECPLRLAVLLPDQSLGARLLSLRQLTDSRLLGLEQPLFGLGHPMQTEGADAAGFARREVGEAAGGGEFRQRRSVVLPGPRFPFAQLALRHGRLLRFGFGGLALALCCCGLFGDTGLVDRLLIGYGRARAVTGQRVGHAPVVGGLGVRRLAERHRGGASSCGGVR